MKLARRLFAAAVILGAGLALVADRHPGGHAPHLQGPIDIPPSTTGGSAPVLDSMLEEPESLFAPASPVHSAGVLHEIFQSMGYDLESLLEGADEVPRVILANLPADLGEVREVKLRKALFVRSVLPLILQVNEEILDERRRLWQVWYDRHMVERIRVEDELWLAVMADKYRTRPGDVAALLERVDIIPPSLALAQAAEESGWGTSRFTREGNAIFGQWTFDDSDSGLVPVARREEADHRVRSFDNLLESVRAYALNLNSHKAYRDFRKRRAALRADGSQVEGLKLAVGLGRYSERGEDYVKTLRAHIRANKLHLLDDVRLRDEAA
jgi:Bax protein